MVLQSKIKDPLGAFWKIPKSDKKLPFDYWHTAFECSEFGNIATKMSASEDNCLMSFLKVMLLFLASVYLLTSTSYAKTWWPFLARLIAIGKPMLPNPIKLTLAKEKMFLTTRFIFFID